MEEMEKEVIQKEAEDGQGVEKAACETPDAGEDRRSGEDEEERTSEEDVSSCKQAAGKDTPVEEPSAPSQDTENGSGEDTEEEREDPDGNDTEADVKKEKTSFRQKKELAKKDAQIEELTDRLKRSMAEFDNFRKRTEKEKSVRFDDGAMYVLNKLLPVADNFERGLAQIPEEEKESGFAKGMEMIYRQLMQMLEDSSVTPIEAVGKEFDPAYHNAVMHVEDESLGEGVVAEEFQKGYLYKDQVLRHSMVKVAN